jgi:hypothetical protein
MRLAYEFICNFAYLAQQGQEVADRFLDETLLSDRVTTLRTYLELHPEIMDEQPPDHLIGRYSG